jgi:hypothetical protein
MQPHKPQLNLRLDTALPDSDAPWHAGGSVVYLGTLLTLILDTAARIPTRIGKELHLPLPPAATPRQIRDTAESWLRDEALRVFSGTIQKSALAGRRPLRVVLTFGKRGDWVRSTGDELRCQWRLVEQPPVIIEQVLEGAMAQAQATSVVDDFFAFC